MKGPVAGSASFEALVRREDVSLEELLMSDEVVGAAKRGHPGLMALCVSHRLKGLRFGDLIEALLDDSGTDELKARRFPFIASEIISSDVPEVLDLFFADEMFLDQLFSALQREQLNPVTAGYFSAVASALLARNAAALVQYMFGKYDYSRDVVRHVGTRAVADLLTHLLKCEQGGSQFAFDKLRILELLVASITPAGTEQFLCNVAAVLQEVVENGKELKGWKVYMAMLLQSHHAYSLIEGLTSDCDTVARVSAELLASLLRLTDLESILAINYGEISRLLKAKAGDTTEDPPAAERTFDVLAELAQKVQVLTDRLCPCVVATVAAKSLTLRPAKLASVKLLSALMRSNSQAVTAALISSRTLAVLTDLFEGHIWSSLLHAEFENVIHTIIEGTSPDLKTDLLVTANIPQRLATLEPCITSETGVKTRKGYMGHVTRIGNYLLSATAAQPLVASHLTFNSDWIVFVNEVLQVRNELEDGKLGQRTGENRRYDSEDDFEDAQDQEKEEENMTLSTPSQLFQDLQSLVLAPSDQPQEDEAFVIEDDVVTYEGESDCQSFLASVYWKVPVSATSLEDLE